MQLNTVGRFHDEDVRHLRRDLCPQQVPILLARKVPCVEDPHSGDFYLEHCRAQHVACVVAAKFDSFVFNRLVVIDQLYLLERCEQILLVPQPVLFIAEIHCVLEHNPVNRLRGMCHEDTPLELSLLGEVRERTAMVVMEVCDEQQIDPRRIDLIEERQGIETRSSWVHAAVEHDGATGVLHDAAGATNLAPRTQRGDFHFLVVGSHY